MKTKSHSIAVKITLVSSMGLYAISLTQQCYCISGACGNHWSGISLLALGAIGGIMSTAGLTWYANPFIWAAWSLINKKPKQAVIFSLLATLLSASFLLAATISDMQANVTSYITGYQPGYWLWLASMVTTSIGSVMVYLVSKDVPLMINNRVVLQVDFNNRCATGVKLITGEDNIFRKGKKKIKLYDGMQAILWDHDYNDKKVDNLAVIAVINYSFKENCWVAGFNFDDLKHESERGHALLEN
ncbi:hypothetical protein [Mucilaginibacter sp. UYCu711]|uniref:hypothetical protein n=1 Tax=Mucilaginibacter sp. UYCu711 TaxID=3156339 RepID=UPI003D19CFC1